MKYEDLDPWMRDPEQLEKFIHGALKHSDIKSVEFGLRFLALADAKRAQRLYDDLKTALHVASGGEVQMVWEPVASGTVQEEAQVSQS